jgi:transposase
MDVHKEVCVICVIDEEGKVAQKSQIRTTTRDLRDFFAGQSGTVHVVFEEGGWSVWLYELIKPLVHSVTVCEARHQYRNRSGNKSDDLDTEAMARGLRSGDLRPVYKGSLQQQELISLSRTYENLVEDATRSQNRIKAIFRGRGVECEGHQVYRRDLRKEWIEKLSSPAIRFRAETLLEELDLQQDLRKKAKLKLLAECQKHPDYKRLLKVTGFGPVRVSLLLAIVGTPYRFRTKQQFRTYGGLSVRTHSSADYTHQDGRIVRKQKKVSTRGLNYNYNRHLKGVFKGAATSALRNKEFRAYYDKLISQGVKSELALLTIARKLANIIFATWQRHEEFDLEKALLKV